CQTYENTELFCYGRNFNQTFLTEDGITNNIPEKNDIHKKDLCLSAGYLFRNKEDEFVPGFFHKNNGEDPGVFNMFRAGIEITKNTPESGGAFTLGRDDTAYASHPGIGRIECFANNNQIAIDPKNPTQLTNISSFWNSMFCTGMTFQIDFDLNTTDPAIRTEARLTELHSNFITKFGGVYCCGNQEQLTLGANNLFRTYIGPPAKFDSTGNSDLDADNSYQKFNVGKVSAYDFLANPGNPVVLNPNQEGAILACEFDQKPYANMTDPPDRGIVGVVVNADNQGRLNGSIYMAGNFGGQSGYKVGMSLKPMADTDPDLPTDWSGVLTAAPNLRFIITQVDGVGGADFLPFSQLTQAQLQLADQTEVKMRIIPLPYYMNGLETFRTGGAQTVNPNAFGFQNTHGAEYFDNYDQYYPPTVDTAWVNSSDNVGVTDEYRTKRLQCGLYRPAGVDKLDPDVSTDSVIIKPHDLNQSLLVTAADNEDTEPLKITNRNFTIGGNAQTDMIYAVGGSLPGQPADTAMFITFNLTAITAAIPAITEVWQLPNQGYLFCNLGTANERHILMGGPITVATVGASTHVTIGIKVANQSTNINYGLISPSTYGAGLSDVVINGRGDGGGVDLNNNVTLTWWNDISSQNSSAQYQMDETNGTGTIAITARQNFYGKNDINYPALINNPNWAEINGGLLSVESLSSYDKGGFYYLTNAVGSLTKTGINIRKFFGFSQGFGEFLLAETLNTLMPYSFQAVYNNKLPLSNGNSFQNNITNIYNYEPYYQQKVFSINRNFVVPSDIASRWNEISHKLTGLVDRDTGEELATVDETGLVQNEFVCPVYGSDNIILPTGNYLKNTNVYPYSSG
ncbi:MAG: hypothetical protein L7S72_10205, partial [Flavobacteriales bacterium]|nr:hypothetical protein [Flavobacteriales bacterium]